MDVTDDIIKPEEQVEHLFFLDFANCVIEDIDYDTLSEKTYQSNKEEIMDFLLVCYSERISCYVSTQLLINLSQNILK